MVHRSASRSDSRKRVTQIPCLLQDEFNDLKDRDLEFEFVDDDVTNPFVFNK